MSCVFHSGWYTCCVVFWWGGVCFWVWSKTTPAFVYVVCEYLVVVLVLWWYCFLRDMSGFGREWFMPVRTFTCLQCRSRWQTERRGNFRYCPECSASRKVKTRTKVCSYTGCGTPFIDSTSRSNMRYCSVDCRYRAKKARKGQEVLAEQEITCAVCMSGFTPRRGNQKFCSALCRKAGNKPERTKVCAACGGFFTDTSSNNNRKYHPECARIVFRGSGVSGSHPQPSRRLSARRDYREKTGRGGRLDKFATLKKGTTTWWGRVAEMVYLAYRPQAADQNALFGSRCSYDFLDLDYGRVDVKGAKARNTPQERLMWQYQTHGLRESCDHAFFVGFSKDRSRVEHLWLVPSSRINSAGMRLAPGSRMYSWSEYEVGGSWGLETAHRVLRESLGSVPDTKPAGHRAWLNDPDYLTGGSSFARGRRGELLYSQRYHDSMDMNLKKGANQPYDFLDLDGTKVDVKSAVPSGNKHNWSFTLRTRSQVQRGHSCDVYSCLCLDPVGREVIHEFRIPTEVLGVRRVIHIPNPPERSQWFKYRA